MADERERYLVEQLVDTKGSQWVEIKVALSAVATVALRVVPWVVSMVEK